MNTELRPLHVLLNTLPQEGRVEWIGIRPSSGGQIRVCDEVTVNSREGIVGDRFNGKPGSARQVTLIQKELLLQPVL